MAKPKREQLTAGATPEKPRPEKPLVELTEDQLEAIARLVATLGTSIFGLVNANATK